MLSFVSHLTLDVFTTTRIYAHHELHVTTESLNCYILSLVPQCRASLGLNYYFLSSARDKPDPSSLGLVEPSHRVPGTASQTEVPTCTHFSGASSHLDSSGLPSSCTSLFLSGSGGGTSTAPMSHVPSVCSSGHDQCVPSTSHIPGSSRGDHQHSFQVEDLDDTAFSQPLSMVALCLTASFYGQLFNTNVSGHSLFVAPENEDLEVTLSLNENI